MGERGRGGRYGAGRCITQLYGEKRKKGNRPRSEWGGGMEGGDGWSCHTSPWKQLLGDAERGREGRRPPELSISVSHLLLLD